MNTAAFVERAVLASAFLGGSLFIGSTWALAAGPCEFLTGIGAYGRQDSLQWRLQQCQRDEKNRRSLEKAKHRIEQHRQRQEATAARRQQQQAADEAAAKRAADEAAMPEWQQHQAAAVRRQQDAALEQARQEKQRERTRASESQQNWEAVDALRREAARAREARCARTGDCGTSPAEVLEQLKRSRREEAQSGAQR